MEIEVINKEINEKCSKFLNFAREIEKLPPVTHLSKSYIQFHGGILGSIQEHREGKRLEKLINEPIYDGKSFYNLAFYMIDELKELVSLQQKVQQMVAKDNPIYYGNINSIWDSFNIAATAWYNYSPDMANAEIEKNANLYYTVRNEGRRLIKTLDSNLKFKDESENDTGGCLGICLLFLFVGIGCSFLLV